MCNVRMREECGVEGERHVPRALNCVCGEALWVYYLSGNGGGCGELMVGSSQ